MKKVVVVGAGASGMMAAITAASKGAKVILLEHMDRVGKKILSTGNGRCNYTNTYQSKECYRSDDQSFPWKIIEQFPVQSILKFFDDLGIYPKDRNGYLYPNSDQATSVLDVLRMELERLNIEVRVSTECTDILPTKKGFKITVCSKNGNKKIDADSVILCTGSKAAPKTGSDGNGYTLAKKLGHTLIPVLPALVQLQCKGNYFKSLAGVRVNGSVSLIIDGQNVSQDTGELQLTNYGISGIPVFQVSRYASVALHEKKKVLAVLDFMPDSSYNEVKSLLEKRIKQRPNKSVEQLFVGMFNQKLSTVWLKLCNLDLKKEVGRLTDQDVRAITSMIKEFTTEVLATNSFEQAQICCGGVNTNEIHSSTMESIYVPGLYFAGELVDVDGICGGYNLTWAWSSGYVSGKSAAGSLNNRK